MAYRRGLWYIIVPFKVRTTYYDYNVEPNISFKFVPIPRPHLSAATYAHPYHDKCIPMPTHAHPCYSNCAHVLKNCNITNNIAPIYAHPCLPMNNNIAPMPTQNPWAWVGMGMGTQCRALLECNYYIILYGVRFNWHCLMGLKPKVEGAQTNTLSHCTYMWLCGWYIKEKCIFILAFALNISIKKEGKRQYYLASNWIFNEYSKS